MTENNSAHDASVSAGNAEYSRTPDAANAEKSGPPKRVLIIAALLVLVGLGVGARMWWRSSNFEETDNAMLAAHVSPVATRIPGVVSKIFVADNQVVKAGEVIAELDPADQMVRIDQIKAQIAQLAAQSQQAVAQIGQTDAEAAAAGAQVQRAEVQLQRASADAARYQSLYSAQMKAVSKTELDAAVATRDAALADLAASRSQLQAGRARVGVSQSSHAALLAQNKVLAAQLQDAELQLGYNHIVAPVSGRVGKKSIELGARVQAGQQLLAIVQEGIWVTANFKETQVGRLQQGQKAAVHIDAFPDREFVGVIESFSPASGAQFSLLPPDNATGNFTKIVQRVPVKITLDPQALAAVATRITPGMSAAVSIDLRRSSR